MNEINYQEKFTTFQAITENNDPDVAMKYLQEANWDENEASRNYFKNVNLTVNNINSTANAKTRVVNNKQERDPYHDNLITSNKSPVQHSIDANPSNNQQSENQRVMSVNSNNSRQTSQGGGFFRTLKNLFCCGQTRDEEEENTLTVSVFESLPGKIESEQIFVNKINEKIGIFIVYQEKDRNFNSFIEKIKTLDHIIEKRENFIFQPVIAFSERHNLINFLLGIKKDEVVVPSYIFVSHKQSGSVNFTRDSIIDQVFAYPSTENFYESLIRAIELSLQTKNQSHNPIRNNPNNQIKLNPHKKKNEINPNSNSVIIQEQKEELMNLLKEEEEKKRKIQEEENRKRKEIEVINKQKIEKEEMIKRKISNLPPEPNVDDKESTLIVVRYSDGNRRSERRFLKSEKIGVLYDFIDSLGNIFLESEKYDLIQTFPRKVYEDKNKTLEEEGLFPNAVLQIREL